MSTPTLGCHAAQVSLYFFEKSSFVVALEHGRITEGYNAVRGDRRLTPRIAGESLGASPVRDLVRSHTHGIGDAVLGFRHLPFAQVAYILPLH